MTCKKKNNFKSLYLEKKSPLLKSFLQISKKDLEEMAFRKKDYEKVIENYDWIENKRDAA